ncbi:mating-type MAT1-1-2 [Purpureocillium lilacinum]|uniref:Mating-type MAT1-1-2 n=1 Tax=Purpureocillium lilacinum TaxID=33203 RepID=A0A179HA16_PURLI|nr:mating-type MAT1-1-2 [Purpureocillium lilacinum]
MDSLSSFAPFWESVDVMQMPTAAIQEIRVQVLNIYLRRHAGEHPRYPSLNYVVVEVIEALRVLLRDLDPDNEILKRLQLMAKIIRVHPRMVIQSALSLWFLSAMPAVSRDPQYGSADANSQNANPIVNPLHPWYDATSTREKNRIANLGVVAMLMTTERWLPEAHPLLVAGSLVSKTVTTLLYACFLISDRLFDEPWQDAIERVRVTEALKLFIKSSWAVSREGFDKMDCPTPGAHLGATHSEVRLTADGNTLITNIGEKGWRVAPIDHPLRVVPGSTWNKFLRNYHEPIFPESAPERRFLAKIPSTVWGVVAPVERFYRELVQRMDVTGRPRDMISGQRAVEQFITFSKGTGSPYPGINLSRATASHLEVPVRDYLYKLPLVKMPMTDLRGHLTFPFMNQLLASFDLQQDREEVDAFFHLVCFQRAR